MTIDPKLSDQFKQTCVKDFEIRLGHALEAARAPDDVFAFRWQGFEIDLCLKRVTQGRRPYWLLILVRLDGGEPQIISGFRVYDDLAGATKPVTPWRLLRSVVEEFGVPVRVGEQEAKFITSASIAMKSERDFAIMSSNAPRASSFMATMCIQVDAGEPPIARCALCYCLDTTRYVAYLRSRRA